MCLATAAAMTFWTVQDNLIARSIYARNFGPRGLPWLVETGLFVLALLPALWLPTRLRKPSDSFLFFVYVLSYLPLILLMPRLSGDLGAALLTAAVILIGFTFAAVISALPRPARMASMVSPLQARAGLLLTLGLSVLLIVSEFGLPTRLPTFQTLYADRAAFLDQGATDLLGKLARYQIFFVIILFLPLIFCFVRSTRAIVGLYVAASTFLYAISTYKIVLVQVLIFLFFYLYQRNREIRTRRLLLYFVIFLLFVCFVLPHVVSAQAEFTVVSAVVRFFMISGLLGSLYHDEFVTNTWSSNETISHQAYAIGTLYFGDDTMLATSSFWMLAFSEGLSAGILWISVVLGASLWLLNWATPTYAARVVITLGASYGYFLSGSAMTTVLGTYGLAPLILILALLPSRPMRANE